MFEKWYDVEWTEKKKVCNNNYYYSHEMVFETEEQANEKVFELQHTKDIVSIMKFTIEKWKKGLDI